MVSYAMLTIAPLPSSARSHSENMPFEVHTSLSKQNPRQLSLETKDILKNNNVGILLEWKLASLVAKCCLSCVQT